MYTQSMLLVDTASDRLLHWHEWICPRLYNVILRDHGNLPACMFSRVPREQNALFTGTKRVRCCCKYLVLAMSWNKAWGHGCNKAQRAADFNGIIRTFLKTEPLDVNLLHHLTNTILQHVWRGTAQISELWVQGRAAMLTEREWECVVFPFTSHPWNLRINVSIVYLKFPWWLTLIFCSCIDISIVIMFLIAVIAETDKKRLLVLGQKKTWSIHYSRWTCYKKLFPEQL